ncbi:hypothetical protein FHR88_001130 [Bradyrhizobium betae]|uniref:hypothetical protein n=1 Tax=Bradyrhizobium sp. TaxID=376 RepID=UPI001FCEE476|nr:MULTISPECIES: hypothetical protein [Bradyrhizobium]MCS3726105.1 hypothetical protein [Bradyrhizobium betae]
MTLDGEQPCFGSRVSRFQLRGTRDAGRHADQGTHGRHSIDKEAVGKVDHPEGPDKDQLDEAQFA